ncbi:MAG: hemolysin family protein [Peptococcaceae bacterium]|nr:hemolysin family protein [Peptococcaceae bacterium]MDH7524544.1 hemolysin family protein [Peptococcaceae bacterium]
MSVSQVVLIFSLLLLLSLSAFFSATETAFFSANKIKIRHLAEEGNKKAAAARRLLEQPNRLISTVLVGNNIVNIAATALATMLAIGLFGKSGAGIATGVMTVLVLVFGEITPKTLASRRAEEFVLGAGRFVNFLGVVFYPVVRLLNSITGFLLKPFGGKLPENPLVTEEEIRMLVNVGQEEGLLDEDEREMIDSIFEFDDTLVREIMVPRIDIAAVSVDETPDAVIKLVVELGHSRIPVYENTVDNIIGVIYAKDLLKPLLEGPDKMPPIRQLMRLAYYVPESKKVRDLFAELRKEKVHMAIVLDEYGGTAGLVTIEDVIEEIVGEIQDEFDKEEKNIEVLADGTLLVDARTSICDINELLELDLPDDEFDTISGLVFHILGRPPQEGQKVEIDNLHVVVEKVAGRRIVKLRLKKVD